MRHEDEIPAPDVPRVPIAPPLERRADQRAAEVKARVTNIVSREGREDELVGIARESDDDVRARVRPLTAPAEGERNAAVGYLAQYEWAAFQTLEALRRQSLQAVRLADVQAGQIDDFQLVSSERVDAHQVKWSQHRGNVGFAEFVRDSADQVAYIRQLADGWQKLRRVHPTRRVVVHFVTNNVASASHNPSIPRPVERAKGEASADTLSAEPRIWSFASFLAEAWTPAVQAARTGGQPRAVIAPWWLPAMEALQQSSQLDSDDWSAFIVDCELEFGAPSLSDVIAVAPVSDAERRLLRQDGNTLAHAFFRLVASPERRVEFSRDALLDFLGWRQRVEFRNRHEFPDPGIPYRAVATTSGEIRQAIEGFAAGYIMVTGSPGSGKSTLLTQLLRESPHRVVRYYAYVPDAPLTNLRRGEAINFLHDITTAFSRAGIRSGVSLATEDLDLLAKRFHEQLQGLHEDWKQSARRTLILVDGLDHIAREQSPVQSLLAQLPPPEGVPEGVLFVLGSQTDALPNLSPRIRDQLAEPGRRISMRPLEREDVLGIVAAERAFVPPLDADAADRIYRLSAGHPLALNYIVNRLRHAGDRPYGAVLAEVEPFSERIDAQYASIWMQLESNVELVRLLALLARARGPVRLAWLRRWSNPQALHDVTTRLSHYFRQERGARWAFFHNSFRAFLLERTKGLPAIGNEAELFSILADCCASSGSLTLERADELYYRARAGDTDSVLSLASPDAFRSQFAHGRSTAAILEDTLHIIDASVARRDPVALTRAILTRAEFGRRSYYEEALPIAETRLNFGDVELAIGNLRSGSELLVTPELGLRAAARLDSEGHRDEALELFSLAEPLDLLRGTPSYVRTSSRDEDSLLGDWAYFAPRFRSTERIQSLIDALGPDYPSRRGGALADEDDRSRAAERRYRLYQSLVRGLDHIGHWNEADNVLEKLRAHGENAIAWWFWSQSFGWRDALAAGKLDRAEQRLRQLTTAESEGQLDHKQLGAEARVVLAEGLFRVFQDAGGASDLLQEVGQPDPVGDHAVPGESGFSVYSERYRLNRILAALGDKRAPGEIVPDVTPKTSDDDGPASGELRTRFERAVVQLAHLEGGWWAGNAPPVEDFRRVVRGLLLVFPPRAQLLRGVYPALQAREEFYLRLVKCSSRCGSSYVAELQSLLNAEWTDVTRNDAWPAFLMRSMVNGMIRAGADTVWCREWLERLEPRVFRGEELQSDLEEGLKQVTSWIAAQDVAAARECFDRVLRATFGSENKDTQLAAFVSWAVRANEVDPGGATTRFSQLGCAAASLEGAEGSGYVASAVMRGVITAGAPLATAMSQWILQHGVKSWVDTNTALVEALAARAPSAAAVLSAYYRNLVLPFERGTEVGVIGELGRALRNVGEEEELRALRDAIEVSALGSARPALREAIADRMAQAAELVRSRHGVSDSTAPSQVVDAFEGLDLTLAQLQERTRSANDVADLRSRLKPNAYDYRWSLIIEQLLSIAGADELVATAELLPPTDRGWEALARIAARLGELGDRRSVEVAQLVLRASSPSGWSPNWDGGSRLRAYELLATLSPTPTHETVWTALRADILSGSVRTSELIDAWDRIVPLLVPVTPSVDIWVVVSNYIEALTAFAPRYDPPILPVLTPSGDGARTRETMYDWASKSLDDPAYAIAQGAQRFFVDRLLAGDAAAEHALLIRVKNDSLPNDGALLVYQAARLRGYSLSQEARDVLRERRFAPNFRDRRAIDALLDLAAYFPSHTQLIPPLPTAFAVVHPRSAPVRRLRVGPGELLPPAENPGELVAAFRPELDEVAAMAHVQSEALYAHVAEVFDEDVKGLPEVLNEEAELQRYLRGVGLQITYRRPRSLRVERAMLRAITTLVDCGRLNAGDLDSLDALFRNADPAFLVARPMVRPSSVRSIRERAESEYMREGWTASASPADCAVGFRSTSSTTADVDDFVVIAEESEIYWPNWQTPRESRVGVRLAVRQWSPLHTAKSVGDDEAAQALGALKSRVRTFSHLLWAEYATDARSSRGIVVRNDAFRFATPGQGWLAFNPSLAELLGWRLAHEGFFRWVDSSGVVMAESVWWQDGFWQHQPPLFEEEIGRGWQVRVMSRAWPAVSVAIGPALDWSAVERQAKQQTATFIENWREVP